MSSNSATCGAESDRSGSSEPLVVLMREACSGLRSPAASAWLKRAELAPEPIVVTRKRLGLPS